MYTITLNNMTQQGVQFLHDALRKQPMELAEPFVSTIRAQVAEQDRARGEQEAAQRAAADKLLDSAQDTSNGVQVD